VLSIFPFLSKEKKKKKKKIYFKKKHRKQQKKIHIFISLIEAKGGGVTRNELLAKNES